MTHQGRDTTNPDSMMKIRQQVERVAPLTASCELHEQLQGIRGNVSVLMGEAGQECYNTSLDINKDWVKFGAACHLRVPQETFGIHSPRDSDLHVLSFSPSPHACSKDLMCSSRSTSLSRNFSGWSTYFMRCSMLSLYFRRKASERRLRPLASRSWI